MEGLKGTGAKPWCRAACLGFLWDTKEVQVRDLEFMRFQLMSGHQKKIVSPCSWWIWMGLSAVLMWEPVAKMPGIDWAGGKKGIWFEQRPQWETASKLHPLFLHLFPSTKFWAGKNWGEGRWQLIFTSIAAISCVLGKWCDCVTVGKACAYRINADITIYFQDSLEITGDN